MKNLILSVAVSAIAAGSANAGLRMIDQDYKVPMEKAVASPVTTPALKATSTETAVKPVVQTAPVATPKPSATVAKPSPQTAQEAAPKPVLRPMAAPMPVSMPAPVLASSAPSPSPVEPIAPIAQEKTVAQAVPVVPPPRPTKAPGYAAFKGDNTIREVLVQWSAMSGWSHEPEHWTVDKDHPIEGNAGPEVFGIEFKAAVRILLASTENSDLPVQPCFYTNRVLRVIAKSASCDRSSN
jgi:hypothetical protein